MSLSALALRVVEPPRDAEPFPVRDVHEEAAGKRDLRRQPRALRLHRVLHGLDEDLLAPLDEVGDLLPVAAPLELGDDDLVDVEEAVLLEADLDEGGLHPREHVVDRAEVDVPRDRAALGPLEVHLGNAVVLEQRDALLAHVDADQELALRRGKRRAALRLSPALAARLPGLAAGALARPVAAAALLGLVLRRRRLGGVGGLSAGRAARLALAAPTATATASPLACGLAVGRGCCRSPGRPARQREPGPRSS